VKLECQENSCENLLSKVSFTIKTQLEPKPYTKQKRKSPFKLPGRKPSRVLTADSDRAPFSQKAPWAGQNAYEKSHFDQAPVNLANSVTKANITLALRDQPGR
jgi:hypothetical protein